MKDKLKGKLKEAEGKATGNKGRELEGKGQGKVGELKQDARETRDKLSGRP